MKVILILCLRQLPLRKGKPCVGARTQTGMIVSTESSVKPPFFCSPWTLPAAQKEAAEKPRRRRPPSKSTSSTQTAPPALPEGPVAPKRRSRPARSMGEPLSCVTEGRIGQMSWCFR